MDHLSQPGQVTLATDFSGLETVAWALRILKVEHRHVFGSDVEASSRKIMDHLGVEMVHADIAQRTLEESSPADIYCIGPPCQPFSRNGRRLGSEDEQGRGVLALRSIAYISHRKPRLVLLEQVPDFLTDEKFSDVRDFILGTLEEFYTLSIKILASSDYGVPQARRRVYVVAVRKDLAGYGGFQFPAPVPCPRLENFITRLGPTEFQTLPSEEIGGGRARENVVRAIQPLIDRGINIFERPFLIETGTTVGRGSASPIGMANTLTRTEAGRGGYWCPYKGGFLTSDELASLQGFPAGLIPCSELRRGSSRS